ncbi:autotransporter outer membrane beta-barrel domain-containing protein, partial [Citrobacter sp. JGM124]|nr:autotransporter outer membrane beta-barrel domain-containing protein [Citrobacter sp. JGM124]
QLVLNNGATVALNSANVADTVGVNIGTDSSLSLSSLAAFNHALTGGGTLSIDADNQAFTFGANTGSGFGGLVNFGNGQLALSGSTSNNSTALTSAILSVDKGATVDVTGGDQSLGGLTLNGGTTTFDDGTITTAKLSVADDATSIIQVEPGQTQADDNLLDQNVGSRHQLVNSTVQLTDKDLGQLTLQDSKGQTLAGNTELAINQDGIDVATGTYNYGLSGIGGGLSTVAKLVKVALTAGQALALDTAGSTSKLFTAQITGRGNLELNANTETLTLDNADNDYTGGTIINSGTVVAGSDNALGATSSLSTLANSRFNLNGKNQTINGALTNAGTVTVGLNGTLTSNSLTNNGAVLLNQGSLINNGALANIGNVNLVGGSLTSGELNNSGIINLGSGTLTLNNGGVSTSVGGLAGNGSLRVTGGELTLSKVNSGLTASTAISEGAAVTLTDTGSLGSGAVSVGGDLNLNATQTLANVLSGDGAVNTGSAVTLSGSNTAFTGSQNIGANGQLTVSSGANLGAGNAVNLTASGAELVLNAVNETLNQVLTGIVGSTVSVKGAGATVLGANNTGFAGNYAVSGSSSLQVSNASNLGTSASVSLAAATDILKLAGYSGIFANQVSGAGQLELNNSSVILNSSQKLANSVGVDIDTNSNLTLSSLTAFNQALTGDGVLNIDAGNQTFAFGANTGSAFDGKVNLNNSQFALSGSNTTNTVALKNAMLSVNKGADVSVTAEGQAIGGLTFNGGTTAFNNGSITTNNLNVTSDSIIQIEPDQARTGNLLDQNVQSREQLVNSTTQLTEQQLQQLTLQNAQGDVLNEGVELAIHQNNADVAQGTYNYLLSGLGGGLSTVSQLVKVALIAGKTLTLDTAGSTTKTFTAQIVGDGNLALNGNSDTLTLTNAQNSYSGTTTINSGIVAAGSDNALGQTASLSTKAGSQFNLNGKTQNISGALTNAGTVTLGQGGNLTSDTLVNSDTVNIDGGTFTLNNGGSSTQEGGLTGNGTLQINGGDLELSKANAGLAGETLIGKDATITLSNTGTLGSASVDVGGNLNLNLNNGQVIGNILSGAGTINTAGTVTLGGTNTFSGTHSIGKNAQLTISKAANLGADSATVDLSDSGAELVLNGLTEALNNNLSGVTDSTISLENAASVKLGGSNSGFNGTYALSGKSTLIASDSDKLGTAASVSLGSQDTLSLEGYNGTFANQVTGQGTVSLSQASGVTLDQSQNLGTGIGVKIEDGSDLNLSGLETFDHALTGYGALNIDANNKDFTFGSTTGSAFFGQVTLNNTLFDLPTNSSALTNAGLTVSSGSIVNVGTSDSAINGLNISKGRVNFSVDRPQTTADGVIKTQNLTLDSGTVGINGSSEWENYSDPSLYSLSVLEQDYGNILMMLVDTQELTGKVNKNLKLNINGEYVETNKQAVFESITQGGQVVADATYNFGLADKGASGTPGLYAKYSLVALNLLTDSEDGLLLQTSAGSSDLRIMRSLLSGVGGLVIDASNGALTIENSDNSYTGDTLVKQGDLILGDDGVLGKTSLLDISAGASTQLNGHSQTIGSLQNSGSLDITGGTLNVTTGGTSSSENGLTGDGTLQVNGGTLTVSNSNAGLLGNTLIEKGAAVALTGLGNLGSAAIDVGGELKLSVSQALANILSGDGEINTDGDVELTGKNTFTGTHNLLGSGTLTIGATNNLGDDSAKVSLNKGTALILSALNGTVNNAITGVAGSTVSLVSAAQATLGGDNSHFEGTYNVSGNSTLSVGTTDQLGADASVLLADTGDTLNLNDFGETFSNSVQGTGTLSLTQGSSATLDASQQLGANIGINISDDSALNLSGLSQFNQALKGEGTLNVNANDQAFSFGDTTGNAFLGDVALSNSQFDLSGNNTTALTKATLSVGDDATVSVTTGTQKIGGLVFNGGITQFTGGDIAATSLDVSKDSVIQVENDLSLGTNLLEQSYGETRTLVASQSLSADKLSMLRLQNLQNEDLNGAVEQDVVQGGQVVGQGFYNYGLSGDNGLSVVARLITLALAEGQKLQLDTANTQEDALTFTAQITGKGNLQLDAASNNLTLANENNDYTGSTTINTGTVVAGSNNALGKTSSLNTLATTGFNLNGYTQTISGALNNAGSVNIAGGNLTSGILTNTGTVDIGDGTLTLTNGGRSDIQDGLTGSGTLNVNAGTLTLSSANAGLSASTLINQGAAITLVDDGTLGNAAVTVDGSLNLNAKQTLGNVLSGIGQVNTAADITLSGNNADFSGTHSVAANGQLTVSQAVNLGADKATVDLSASGAELVLSGVKEAVNQALNGGAGTLVSVTDESATILGGDNSGFLGQYAVSGGSSVQVSKTSALGDKASVSLEGGNAILSLSGFDGVFANTVSGEGQLMLNNGASVTLNNTNVAETVGVDISADNDLTLANLTAFNHSLSGSGDLNINSDNQAFNFGANTGDSFGGNVTLNNTIFNLNTNNVAALNSAKLTLDSGSQVNVGNTDNVLNKLDIKDGTLAFEADAPQSKANGTVTVNDLNLAGGVISVTGNSNWENTTPVVAPGVSILEQDAGNVLMTLIDAKNVSGNVNDLTLSINGTKVTEAEQAILSTITQGGVDAAQATYNYGLTDANNGQGGLYVKYGLTALKLLTDGADALVLATAGGSTNQTLNALLSGTGGLNIDASKGDLTLANGNNSYTGETTVNAGNLLLGANGALGQTSALNIAKEASTSLNGFKQTVGQLNNGGKLDLAGGELALNQGGYSTETDGLKGNGTLTINGGDFAVSGTNASLSGKTVIQDTASVTLTDAGTLGSSNIDISSNGALNLNVADLNLGNTLSGAGKVNINAATILSGNSDFTGEHHVGENASLTVSDGSNIGAKDATVHLDNATSSLVLKALSGAVNNALYGVADSIVALTNGAKAQLNGDNSGFLGRYTVNGNSALIVTAANNLGNASGVELTNAGDKLVLSGYQGDFTHSVTGNGELNFTDAADVIFNSDYNVDNTIGMNIDTNSSLTLDGLDVFNHQLDGSGVLNINNGGNDFHFGNNTGKAFTGNVNLNNTGFTLTADNDLLQNAYLTLSKESLVTVSNGEQKVAGLSMNGGTLKFDNIVDNNGQFTSQGTVTAGTIDVTGGGNVQVALPTNVTPGLDGEGKSLLELDAGNIILQLAQGNANGSGSELVLQDENGEKITAGITADLTNQGATSAAAKGTFDYGLSTGDKLDGLYINYGLKAIELLASGADALKVQALADKVNSLSSLISGTGDLAIEGLSDDAILTLTNGKNDYTGATLVNRGGLKLSADGALGDTSELAMAEGTSVDINNTTQTAGKLNSAINTVLNLNGGTLTVKDGGQIAGTLLGAGQFNLQGGQLAISQANTGFTGNTSIDSAASATLNNVAGLGSGSIANKGTLTLDGAEGNFANNLTENGKLQLQNKAAITLTGNNSQYSGAFITDEGTSITASKADQVGTSSVNNNGTFIFNVTDDWSFNNVLNGSGELVKQGAGTLKFTGDSVTASNTVIENGLVQLGEGTTKSLDEVTIGQQTVKAAADTSTQTPFNLNSNVTIQQQGALGGFGNVTGNVDNAGRLVMSHALTGDRFADFTINGNYTGQAGSSIIFDTVLAGDDSATDRLVIKGDSSGVGTVYVNNISGQGAYTNNGIKIIDISGKSGANFELGGRVVAGAYEYKLYQGGTGSTGGTGDGNWYLRTENPDRPEAGSYIANLAAANTLFNTNLEDRSGETWYTDAMTGEKKATSMWLRTSGSHNRSRDDNSNFKTQDNRFVTQLGGDILRFNRDANDLWRLGVMAGYGQSNNNTHTSQSGSESKGSVKGYSIGTYGTWFADTETNTGAYVDTWLQYSWFKNEVNGQDLATEKYDSKGFTGSLEGGYTFQTGASENYDFYVQPKAQAIWMGVKADGHKEASNTQISGTGNGNVQTRIGLKAFVTKSAQEKETQSQLFKPYAELSWVHNSKDFGVEMSHETTGSQTIKQGGAKNVAEVKLGLEGDVTNRLNMWGNVTQQVGGKGYSETSVTFGVKYNF